MDEAIKQLLVNSPMLAILLIALKIVYEDGKSDRAGAAIERKMLIDKLDEALDQLDDMKLRLVRLEVSTFGEKFPTEGKRPPDVKDRSANV